MNPCLSLERVLIRRFRQEDTQPFYEAVRESLNGLTRWMTWCREDYSFTDAVGFISAHDAGWSKGEHYSFVVVDRPTGRILGGVGINFVNPLHRFANLGYWVRASHQGQGIATLAARLAGGFALSRLGLERLEIVAAVENLPSQRVAEKTGAAREGVLRARLVLNGRRHDAVMYSLVQSDLGHLPIPADDEVLCSAPSP